MSSGIGFLALFGVSVQTAVVYISYVNELRRNGTTLTEAIREGAILRLRPIMMTVAAIIAGLLPIMLGGGTGSEVMRRIAAPMVGGMVSATLLTLIVIPAVFLVWKTCCLVDR